MDVRNVGSMSGPQAIQRVAAPAVSPSTSELRPVAQQDVLELSPATQAAGEINLEAEFRAEQLAQIRQEILEGTYDTDEKLELALNRMLERLQSE